MRNIRGYSFDIGITLFWHRVELNITPFSWNRPMLCIAKPKMMTTSWHLNFGCLHLWGMETSNLFAIELNFDYLHFWWDKPKCPETMTRIF